MGRENFHFAGFCFSCWDPAINGSPYLESSLKIFELPSDQKSDESQKAVLCDEQRHFGRVSSERQKRDNSVNTYSRASGASERSERCERMNVGSDRVALSKRDRL